MEHNLIRKSFIVIVILVVAILSTALVFGVNTAAAEEELDEFDRAFVQTAEELGIAESSVIYSRLPVYDTDGRALGYVFDYSANGGYGYAVAIEDESGVKVTEVCPGAENPFAKAKGLPVYTKEFEYWDKEGGFFTSLTSGEKLLKAEFLQACPIRYGAVGDGLLSGGKTVNYENRQVSSFSLANTPPAYCYEVTPNACAPIAAGNIVAYFDRYCTQLIPDYTPGSGFGSRYNYKSVQGAEIDGVMAQLCMDMGTDEGGNTEEECLNGLSAYCTRAGYGVSYESCMNASGLDYNKAKQSLQTDKKPLLLFVTKLEISKITEEGGRDIYTTRYGQCNHVMSAFGYYEVTYSLSGGSSETGRFLQVASGIETMKTAYLNMDNNLQTVKAYSVNIE